MRRILSFINTGKMSKLALVGLFFPAFPAVAAETPSGDKGVSLETNNFILMDINKWETRGAPVAYHVAGAFFICVLPEVTDIINLS